MKKLSLLFLACTLLFAGQLYAQTPAAGREVSGVVLDTTGTGVLGATVTLTRVGGPGDTVRIRTNADGIFVLKGVKVSQFNISVKSLGYSEYNKRFLYTDGTSRIVLDKIILRTGASLLEEVVITGAPPVTVKQDTIEYRASDFKLKENAVVEDALKRVDGVEVDKDGNVTAQGKAVTKFRVNGKDYFGGDLKTATKNIPADAVDKIQLIDDYGDQANFTGVRDGDPETIINITTRPGRDKGFIANATAGGGTDELYQFSGFANQIQGERNLGMTANLNNNGTQVGGGGFGGRGGGGGNNGGGGGNFGGGGNNGGGRGGNPGGGNNSGGGFGGGGGLTTLGSIGINYTNRWSPKLVVTGAYYYNNNDNSTITNTVSETGFSNDRIIYGTAFKNQGTLSNSHNMNGMFQYSINKNNLLVIRPSVTFYDSKSNISNNIAQTGFIHQDQVTTSGTKASTPSYGFNALYNHLFKKAGRNYSLNLNVRNNEQNADDDNDNVITYYDAKFPGGSRDSIDHRLNVTRNQTFTGSSRLVYSEPLSLTSRLQFSYNLNYNNYDNSKITNFVRAGDILQKIDSLSNVFQYSFTSHQLGLNYNYRNQNNELSLGVSANPTELSGNSVTLNTKIQRSNFYLAPILSYTYRYSRTKALMVRYFSRAVEPQFAQLQPVRDVSDPQRPIVGNPDLNSSFTHQVFANYNTSNPQKRTSFFLNFNGQTTKDRIVTNTVLVPDSVVVGSVVTKTFKQETRYLNTNGAYSYGGNYNFQKSFADRQYTVRLNGYAGYNQNVAFTDNDKSFSKAWDFRQALGLMINPGNWLELTPNVAYSLSDINYTSPDNTDTKIQSYSFNVDGSLFFLKSKSLILRFNGGKSFNSGYATDELNTNPLIINSSIEKQFLKNRTATIKFQAFDILKESNNITHTDLGIGFRDVRTNRLTQYFMLTLTMRVNRFAGGNAAGGNQQRGGGGAGGFGGGGGGQRGGGGF